MNEKLNRNLRILTWLPFVSGPALAILIIPAPVCFKSGWISSLNVELFEWTILVNK